MRSSDPASLTLMTIVIFLLLGFVNASIWDGPPFCAPRDPGFCVLNWAHFNNLSDNHANPNAADVWINDHYCNVIGNASDIPVTPDSDYTGYGMTSQLPWVVILHPHDNKVPDFDYAGRTYPSDGCDCEAGNSLAKAPKTFCTQLFKCST